jgi:hypothetical protein
MIMFLDPGWPLLLLWTATGAAIIVNHLNRKNYCWRDPIATICMCLMCGLVLGPLAFIVTISDGGQS